jgi:FdhD protein
VAGRSKTKLITKYRQGDAEPRRVPDQLIVEEPLSIHLDDILVATTMRTPGADFELAAGFCNSEGLLYGAPIGSIKYCGTGPAVETEFNVVSVDTRGLAPPPTPRLTLSSSSCGLCGSDAIDALTERLAPLSIEPLPVELLASIPEAVRPLQELFGTTGAIHAAAAFDGDGQVIVVREDIGRHNAVDKVVGRLLLDDSLPASGLGLFVSGRASFEMVQKAWAAGFGTLVAVSGPSALAVETAEAASIQLAGFVRDGGLNVYC